MTLLLRPLDRIRLAVLDASIALDRWLLRRALRRLGHELDTAVLEVGLPADAAIIERGVTLHAEATELLDGRPEAR